MTESEDRLAALVKRGEALAKTAENRGGLLLVERGRFREFRASALSALRDIFGPEHPHYREFDKHADSSVKTHVEVGVGVLTAALDDVMRGSVRRAVGALTFEMLLHAAVAEHALPQFKNGHYREAVFNSIVSVFDLLRARTGLNGDGMKLAQEALSLQRPRLIVADLATESGRNEQLGMMKMLEGAYLGVRNPKAHTLAHDTQPEVAAQYMIFASMLARRISEARVFAA